MEEQRKILIIDNAKDRKQRIAALKSRGYAVYPALKLTEARNRCKPGTYDLIVVNSGDEPDAAIALCDSILREAPKQLVLLLAESDRPLPPRNYLAPLDTDGLVARVDSLLRRNSDNADLTLAA